MKVVEMSGPIARETPRTVSWRPSSSTALTVSGYGVRFFVDGVVYPMGGVFHEIVAPERLAFAATALADEKGNPQLEVLNTLTFTELGGKTQVTLQARVVKSTLAAAAALAGMEEGWRQSLDRLAEHLAEARNL